MTNLLEHDPTRVVGQFAADSTSAPVLEAIRSRRVLRVCFAQPRLPFVFRNARGDLVGFDIELAHLLARDLAVSVEFAEWPVEELAGAVSDGRCDLGIGGNPVTPNQALRSLYSEPYLDETVAFIVKDYLRARFETWSSIQQIRDLTIGVPPLPYYEQLLKTRLPDVPLQVFEFGADPLSDQLGFDAVALPAERGSGAHDAEPEMDGGRAGAGPDQGAAGIPAGASRPGMGQFRQFLDRAETPRRIAGWPV